MTYNEISSGGIAVGGCVLVEKLYQIVTNFGIGDTLYSSAKARKGKLEKVVIKVVRIVSSRKTFGKHVALYMDTLNGLWNEDELVPYDRAVDLINQYHSFVELEQSKLRC
ncbi:MAG: hypothetical protein J5I93_28540 [Pirellulaceae bacterium]|nr:hypothetical protein [Pirellulaceae bacterium]